MRPEATANDAEALSAACRSKRIKLATAGIGSTCPEKPVGPVWFGLAQTGTPAMTNRQIFPAIRAATGAHAFELLRDPA